MKYRIPFLIIILIVFSLIYYYFSIIYIEDDQYLYNLYYNNIVGLDIVEAYNEYNIILGASEPIYFFITYFFSQYIEKIFLMLVINVFLLYLIIDKLEKLNKSLFVVYLVTNFYFVALLFSHERLKVAVFLFLLFSFINCVPNFLRKILISFTHFQFLLIYIPELLYSSIFGDKRKYLTFIALVIFILISYLFKDAIMAKVLIYFNQISILKILDSFVKISLFTLLGYSLSNNFGKYFFLQLFLLITSIFVGGERIVIFSYAAYMYEFFIKSNAKLIHKLPVHIISLYFSIKGFLFLVNIIDHGHGF